jgi:hypothetical protein
VTLDELKADVWSQLPVRKLVVGKRRVHNWIELAIENWQEEEFAAAPEGYQRELVVQGVVQSIRRMDEVMSDEEPKQYGFIWMLILSGLVSLVVQLLLKWWSKDESHRASMQQWKTEMTA